MTIRKLEMFGYCDEQGKIKDEFLRELLMQKFREFGMKGQEFMIELGLPKRTTVANRYYWAGVLGSIRDGLQDGGIDVTCEGLHEMYKRKYTKPKIRKSYRPLDRSGCILSDDSIDTAEHVSWELIEEKYYSSAKMNKSQFYEYVEKIIHDDLVIRAGIQIDTPEQYERKNRVRIYSGNITEHET